MDRLRTLLLARANTVVLDPSTGSPASDSELDAFDAELADLGYVLTGELARALRTLAAPAFADASNWIVTELATQLGAHRPHVPLFRQFPDGTPDDTTSLYWKRVISWLATRAEQPCPWCGQTKHVAALDPCGHLVCRACWDGASYSGCPICHRRVAPGEPFVTLPRRAAPVQSRRGGVLQLLQLGHNAPALAKAQFDRLIARTTPLSPDDRAWLDALIATFGARAVAWLPPKIAVKETMALAVAALWRADRDTIAPTLPHLRTATDVLRVAVVLMAGNAELVEPMQLRSIARRLRRALLGALDRLPPDAMFDEVRRRAPLWKRVGERLHPFERAAELPNAALAFAIARGTHLDAMPELRDRAAASPTVTMRGDVARATAWAGPIEDALRANNPRSALARLTHRPGDLLRRADHLLRLAQDHQVDALETVARGIRIAVTRGAPATLFTLASHLGRRGAPWPRRVFFPKGDVLRGWGTPDRRAPLRSDAIGALVGAIRRELLERAESLAAIPRAVIDRSIVDLLLPIGERSASAAKVAWPRGSEIALPSGNTLRLFLHWEEPPRRRVDLDLSLAMFDDNWRHVATCDFTNLVVHGGGHRAAVHSGDLTSAPAPLGATELVDLDIEALRMANARHVVMVVFSYNDVPFDELPYGFAGIMIAPERTFDPRTVAQRFDLRGRSVITVPLTIDLAEQRLRWIDAHVAGRGALHQVGGYRAGLAHIGRDFADLTSTQARPTMWDVAAVHAAARANLVHVRERDGGFSTYRRRERESSHLRLGRLLSGGNDDGRTAAIPGGELWFALGNVGDLVLGPGSRGYLLDSRGAPPSITRLAAGDLIAELARDVP